MELLLTWWEDACSFFQQYIAAPFLKIGWLDVLDILLLAIVLFEVYRFSRTRRAGRVLAGLVVVVLASLLVTLLQLPALTYLIRLCASVSFFCVVLIFQPEIRDGLERIGNSRLVSPRSDTLPRKQLPAARQVAGETVDAVFRMSESCTGALIVFEGLTRLGDCIESGKIIDARVTSHLLQNIFFDKAPLHDGALIIRDMRIWAASCVLPSTKSQMDFGNMGTRHRAAVGISEVSDALVVVVSEQTGTVSVAQDGKLLRGVDRESLKDILMTYLAGSLYLRTQRQEARAAKAASAMADKATAAAEQTVLASLTPEPVATAEEPDTDPASDGESPDSQEAAQSDESDNTDENGRI